MAEGEKRNLQQNRWMFAAALFGIGLQWLPAAIDPNGPGGEDITPEEIAVVIARLFASIGFSVDVPKVQAFVRDVIGVDL